MRIDDSVPWALQKCRVYTPAALASALVASVGDDGKPLWLEPSMGEGAFVNALLRYGVPAERILGVDLNCDARTNWTGVRTLAGTDFLAWAQLSCTERFGRIIGNPPYVALSDLPPDLRLIAGQLRWADGDSIPSTSNYWYAFLCASLMLLAPGGTLAFVLPAGYEYCNYAQSLRDRLPQLFTCVEVHRCLRPLFDGVRDGAVVLIARAYLHGPGQTHRIEYPDAAALIRGLEQPRRTLEESPPAPAGRALPGVTLRDVMDIRLGGVTGAANFFLLTEYDRCKYGLSDKCVVPVLSRSRHLVASEITRHAWARLRNSGERVWLFRPTDDSLVERSTQDYLKLGDGLRGKYKLRQRHPWYLTPLPEGRDVFISGTSRTGPWACINRMPELHATNTLYVGTFKQTRLSLDEKASWALSLLVGLDDCGRGRKYADGLLKFEPGDLYATSVSIPQRTGGALKIYALSLS